ncbi:hypothetical protein LNI90_11680 [Tenacibaculum dicentrarchi]|nr:hypothetical protein [Tenacibaculum dicentrarchi]MCD8421198.1 hypothetical protein [Tenacibaculum dicentrarchi]MCD8438393.1 hypothetical protein [Tenacibaculum dicentrarchi]MCD8452743.1 hypothetical protein [Tenacibaculum dicentrarchi]MCG8829032.1 hypothetical protein [Tenacibaculum dicentrarchi]
MNEQQKIILKEYLPEKSREFIVNLYPILNNEIIIKKEIHKFLGNDDYKEYRLVRDSLLWNDLIVLRHEHNENEDRYSLMPKGVEYIKQENKDWINNYS